MTRYCPEHKEDVPLELMGQTRDGGEVFKCPECRACFTTGDLPDIPDVEVRPKPEEPEQKELPYRPG